jgi:hypothetical protein
MAAPGILAEQGNLFRSVERVIALQTVDWGHLAELVQEAFIKLHKPVAAPGMSQQADCFIPVRGFDNRRGVVER